MIAGKGHEQGQDVGGVVTPFDDRDVARGAAPRPRGRRVIPLDWAELEALDLGALARSTGRRADHAHPRRLATCEPTGDLFVALNTGTRFVDDALANGAATLVPRDQHAALATLARTVRRRSTAKVVAVVGSTGKTSTKDALAALCAAVVPTVAAEASKNNEIGLPLTVLRLERRDARCSSPRWGCGVTARSRSCCAIAEPHVALVTSIGPEHLELVGTVADVARANAEAIEALPAGGIAVIPTDAPELEPFLARADLELRRFDRAGVERVLASDELSQAAGASSWRFRVGTAGGRARPAVRSAPPRRERPRRAHGVRRARSAARAGAGRREPDPALGLER